MISRLEDNPVGIVLASVCGGLLVLSLLLAVIWALPASSTSLGEDGENTVPGLEIPELSASETIDKYAVITEHPVFNGSRLPIIEPELDDTDEEEVPEEEVDAPDLQLTGVIITPSIRMATLQQKGEGMSLVAFVGKPLEGDFGTWRVSRIDRRQVTLSSAKGEKVQLKLEVHGVSMAQPPKVEPGTKENKQDKNGQGKQDNDQPLSRAEEIRQRIAERREELRTAAEEKEDAEPVSYQQAIQAMMGKNRREKSKNESDD